MRHREHGDADVDRTPLVGRPRGPLWRALQADGVVWEGQVLLVGPEVDLAARVIVTQKRLAFARGGTLALDVPRAWLHPAPVVRPDGTLLLSIRTSGEEDAGTERVLLRMRDGHPATFHLLDLLGGDAARSGRATPTGSPAGPQRRPTVLPPLPDPTPRLAAGRAPTAPLPVSPLDPFGALPAGAAATGPGAMLEPVVRPAPPPAAIGRDRDWNLQPIREMVPQARRRRRGWGLRLTGLLVLLAGAYVGISQVPSRPNDRAAIDLPAATGRSGSSVAGLLQPTAQLSAADQTALAVGVGGLQETAAAAAASTATSTATSAATTAPTATVEASPTPTAAPDPTPTAVPTAGTTAAAIAPTTFARATANAAIAPSPTASPPPTAAPPPVPTATIAPSATPPPSTAAPPPAPTAVPAPSPTAPPTTAPAAVEPTIAPPPTATPPPAPSPTATATAVVPTAAPTGEPAPAGVTAPTQAPSVGVDQVPDQVVAVGPLRYTVEVAQRGTPLPEFSLPPTSDEEWVALILRARNTGDAPAELATERLALRAEPTGETVELYGGTGAVAAQLGLDTPFEPGETIRFDPGQERRLAAVFRVPADTEGATLLIGDAALDLAAALDAAGAVADADSAADAAAPDLVEATVTRIIDGERIEVALGEARVRVRYLGVDAPTGDRCYAPESAAANAELVEGATVWLERQRSDADVLGTLLRDVWVDDGAGGRTLVAARLAAEGAVRANPDGGNLRYAGWIAAAAAAAEAEGAGLWGACPAASSAEPPPAALDARPFALGPWWRRGR